MAIWAKHVVHVEINNTILTVVCADGTAKDLESSFVSKQQVAYLKITLKHAVW
jgi:hypothetical protein